ncbi:Capsule biosynthesis protein capA [Geitlerinema sp. FC II]|nr:CapA family protein [Geitlerinema sp. CS-897]PPT10206.1 Capsule biosynthesis protein capA [Geitlerinema sp. FC II]
MGVQPLLTLARRGDSQAIAALVGRVLQAQHLNVRVRTQQGWLQVLLESNSIPDPKACVPLLKRELRRVEISGVRAAIVYGRKTGETTPTWVQKFGLVATGTAASSQPVGVSPSKATSRRSLPHQTPRSRGRSPRLVLALGVFGFSLGGAWGLLERNLLPTSLQQQFAQASQGFDRTVGELTTPRSLDRLAETNLADSLPPPVEIPDPYPATITIKAVGDIVPGTNFPYHKLPANPDILFSNVAAYLASADLTFGNFESVLTDYPYSAKDISRGAVFAFRAPPSYASLFQQVGFDVLNVANNHSMDFGEPGLTDTIRHFNNVGIQMVGEKDRILYTQANTIPIAFIGFSTYDYHNSILDYDGAKQLVAEASQNAEIVVVSIHAGAEGTGAMHVSDRQESFFGENRGNIVRFSRTVIDAGADLVLGHGPHVPRAIELYQNKLIAYSLGNFVGYETLSTDAQLAYSLILEVKVNLDGDLVSGKIIPVHLGSDGIPRIDNYFRSVGLIRDLTRSDFPNTPITISESGEILIQ